MSSQINAVDTIPPTFPYFPPDTVLDCTEAYPQPGDSAIWMATAADDFCPFEVSWTDSLAAGSCAGADTLFRTFTAIDDCENTTTQVQILSVLLTPSAVHHRLAGRHPHRLWF